MGDVREDDRCQKVGRCEVVGKRSIVRGKNSRLVKEDWKLDLKYQDRENK